MRLLCESKGPLQLVAWLVIPIVRGCGWQPLSVHVVCRPPFNRESDRAFLRTRLLVVSAKLVLLSRRCAGAHIGQWLWHFWATGFLQHKWSGRVYLHSCFGRALHGNAYTLLCWCNLPMGLGVCFARSAQTARHVASRVHWKGRCGMHRRIIHPRPLEARFWPIVASWGASRTIALASLLCCRC